MDQACPSHEELSAFRAGNLPTDSFESVARHLEACGRCLAVLDTLSRAEDSSLAGPRGPVPSDAFAQEPQCQELVTRFASAFREAVAPAGVAQDVTNTRPFPVSPEAPTPPLEGADDDRSAGAPSAGAAPKRFGKYEILEIIGGGGMGIVYKARDTALGRLVALKTIRSGILASQEEIERFHREARAIAQLKDPHIITVHDFGVDEGVPYFVMALLPGGTLAEQKDFYFKASPDQAVLVVEKIARALHVAHERGILHRDIKPSNILLDEKGEPIIADFGLAKTQGAGSDITHDDRALGTIPYMSPEQTAGFPNKPHAAAEVWSLGVVLFELLTNGRPFVAPSREQLIADIRSADPPSPSRRRHNLHRDLEAVILKCLEKDPARRYETALALAQDLADWREGKPTRARPLGWPEKTWRKTKRNWKIPVAIAGVLCIIWVLWAIYAIPDRERKDPPDPNEWERVVSTKLKDAGKVTLIGPQGGPLGFRWIFGEDSTKVRARDDDPFWISSGDLCLIELMPNVPGEGFKLSAEIKQDTSAQGVCEVGLFFANTILPNYKKNDPTPARSLMKFSFNEFESHLDGNVQKSWLFLQSRIFAHFDKEPSNPAGGQKIRFDPAPNKWRKLFVSVGPRDVAAKFDGIVLEKQAWGNLPTRNPDADMELNRQGGLGIFIRLGAAYYRNVELSTLPGQK